MIEVITLVLVALALVVQCVRVRQGRHQIRLMRPSTRPYIRIHADHKQRVQYVVHTQDIEVDWTYDEKPVK